MRFLRVALLPEYHAKFIKVDFDKAKHNIVYF